MPLVAPQPRHSGATAPEKQLSSAAGIRIASEVSPEEPMPGRTAVLYRMVLPDHVCPYGVRAKQLLEQAGFDIVEHILATRMETDALMAELGVATTPQVFIDGERIGGSEEIARYVEDLSASA
jgi:glutaredoxin